MGPLSVTLDSAPMDEAGMVIAQAVLEKGLLDGMTLGVETITQSFKTGGWVWVALAVGVFFLYKRLRA